MVKDLYDGVFLVREDNENKGNYEMCMRYNLILLMIYVFTSLYIDGRKSLIIS